METENNNRLRHQVQSLRSSNKSAILITLRELRSKGSASILPELFQLMLAQEDEQILGEISALLNDLKDKDAAEVLVDAIANPEYQNIQQILVAACWQNGLSYSLYLDTFVEVLISGEYEAAIEAFTVLEGAIGEVDPQVREKLSSRLKSRLNEVDDLKKPLLTEMVKTIETY